MKAKLIEKLKALYAWYKTTIIYKKYRGLADTMAPMSWSQRIEYLWFSYKEVMLIVAVLLVLSISIAVSISRNDKETIFGGSFINVDMKQAGIDYLQSQLLAELGGDPETQQVEIVANSFEVSYNQLDYNYNMAMSTFGYIDAGIIDYIIGDRLGMEWYISDQIFMDLALVFPKEELEELAAKDLLVYARAENSQTRTPIAIKIMDTAFAKDNLKSKDEIYLMFVGPFEFAEQYHDFYEYLMAWESVTPEETA